jgi:Leucine-rich repeat (LRR) protein
MSYIEYQRVGNGICFRLKTLQELKLLQDKNKIIVLEFVNFNYTFLDIEFDEFTNLQQIIIQYCYNLTSLSSLISLPRLKSCLNLQELIIIDNANLTFIPSLESYINLQQLTIYGNTSLTSIPSLDSCVNLQELIIERNLKLKSIPSLESCVNLKILFIIYNDNLTSIPSLEKCINLEELNIYDNTSLTFIPSLESCINLQQLSINYNYKLKVLPKGIQYLNKLGYYKKINKTVNNEYPENERIPELIHYIIKNYYYYIPIIKYYTKKYLNNYF